tara:strand:- start:1458 stop:1931 length:474 start_codon:yes stop_codon:yes gene_type:complete
MTTNTTKLAEAIGIISNVMTSELAKANSSVANEQNILMDDYDDLKDIAEKFNSEVNSTVGIIQGEIDNCLEWETGDNEPNEHIWDTDVEEESTNDTEESDTTEGTESEETPAGDLKEKITELELTNAKLIAVIENISENINDLYEVNESFEEDLGEY